MHKIHINDSIAPFMSAKHELLAKTHLITDPMNQAAKDLSPTELVVFLYMLTIPKFGSLKLYSKEAISKHFRISKKEADEVITKLKEKEYLILGNFADKRGYTALEVVLGKEDVSLYKLGLKKLNI